MVNRMRYRLRISTALLTCVWAATSFAETPTPADEGFVSLFNGKDLSHWVVMGKATSWKVQGGVIRSEGGSGGYWLRSKKRYEDFVFQVEWKISSGGNSGVYIRSAEEKNPWETGYEIQISNAPRDALHCTGALYGHFAVNPRPDESPNRWHTFEIHCRGTQLKVIADGVVCVEADQAQSATAKNKPLHGYVGLQDAHAPVGHYVEYRNVKIKELSPRLD